MNFIATCSRKFSLGSFFIGGILAVACLPQCILVSLSRCGLHFFSFALKAGSKYYDNICIEGWIREKKGE